MNSEMPSSPVEWARRVNRSWIVRGQLADHAESWLDHLAALNDDRLEASATAAKAMCGLRQRQDDPKPWFYAGLFHLATADEAARFLASHRVTKAVTPSMENDEDVRLWIDRVGPETVELLDRLRAAIRSLPPHSESRDRPRGD